MRRHRWDNARTDEEDDDLDSWAKG
jgi:hypothetical protein